MDLLSLVANNLGLQREVNDFLVTANNLGFLRILNVVADTWLKVCLLRGAIWDRIAGRHRDIIYLSVGTILILAMIVDLLLGIYQTFGWLIQYSVVAGITPIVLVTGSLSYVSQSIDFTSYPRVWTISSYFSENQWISGIGVVDCCCRCHPDFRSNRVSDHELLLGCGFDADCSDAVDLPVSEIRLHTN